MVVTIEDVTKGNQNQDITRMIKAQLRLYVVQYQGPKLRALDLRTVAKNMG